MKKIIILSISLAIVVIACQRKSIPVVTQRTEQPPPPPVQPVAAAPIASTADLDAGKVIYEGKCAKCHEPKPIENWTVEGWKPILKSMVRKSKLDPTETANVTAYVNAHAKKM